MVLETLAIPRSELHTRLIVLEGCDRVGKDTQAQMLADHLEVEGNRVSVFSFPDYDSLTGEFVGEFLDGNIRLEDVNLPSHGCGTDTHHEQLESLMFQCVQICDKYARIPAIMSRLSAGEYVIVSRWWQSAYVYGLESGSSPSWLTSVLFGFPFAGTNILLDWDESIIKSRAEASGSGDIFERNLPMQARLAESYRELWNNKNQKLNSYHVVSIEGPSAQVHQRVLDVIPTPVKF